MRRLARSGFLRKLAKPGAKSCGVPGVRVSNANGMSELLCAARLPMPDLGDLALASWATHFLLCTGLCLPWVPEEATFLVTSLDPAPSGEDEQGTRPFQNTRLAFHRFASRSPEEKPPEPSRHQAPTKFLHRPSNLAEAIATE